MKSDFDEKKTALAFFEWYDKPIRHIVDNRNGVWGVMPRNKEQRFALDMLLNPSIPLVSVVGKAGCGKSLLCLAAGLEQVLSPESNYKRLIVARPVQPMGKDIGNLSAHEIKTIITRVGENTKIVFTGDIDQIDNVYVDATSNGLSYVVEKMKDQYIAGHITLKKGERSILASIASKIL